MHCMSDWPGVVADCCRPVSTLALERLCLLPDNDRAHPFERAIALALADASAAAAENERETKSIRHRDGAQPAGDDPKQPYPPLAPRPERLDPHPRHTSSGPISIL